LVSVDVVVYQATGSAAQTGLLFALRVVPYLMFGLIADCGNRRRLIIGGILAQGMLVATIPTAHLFDVLTVAQIYVVVLPRRPCSCSPTQQCSGPSQPSSSPNGSPQIPGIRKRSATREWTS